MTDERAIIKLGLKLVKAVRTESRSKRQFGSLFIIPFITIEVHLNGSGKITANCPISHNFKQIIYISSVGNKYYIYVFTGATL